MLQTCAEMQPGQGLLIVQEVDEQQIYDPGLLQDTVHHARAMGLKVDVETVPFVAESPRASPALAQRMLAYDRTLFLARIGDQLRFSDSLAGVRPIVCYALDREMMASGFGQADHRALSALKQLVNRAIAQAGDIRITCPHGTDLSGAAMGFDPDGGDTSVARFPLSVFTPVPMQGFHGRIAQTGFLIGTGSNYYRPYALELHDTLTFQIEGCRITGLDGQTADIDRANAHYSEIGSRYGIDPWFIHSWHAGIHPGCAYRDPVGACPERWSGSAFGNPRLLHFHSCGDYPPGEISLNVLDPTVRIDDIALWDRGRLHPERIEGGPELLERFECLRRLCAEPEPEVGLAGGNRLTLWPEATTTE